MLYGIKDCANLTLKSKKTGLPELFSDYANVATNEWTSERTFANSKGTRSIAWDGNRTSTLAVEMEVFDLKWLAIVAGSELTTGEANIAKREVVRVGAGKTATLTGSPVAGSIAVVKLNADLVTHDGEPLEQVASAPAGAQYSATGNTVTFASDAVEGDAYAVYFLVQDSNVKTIDIKSNKFPENFEVYADAFIREKETGKDSFVQIHYPNAKPQSNFTITMSATEPTNLAVTFDLFPDAEKSIATIKVIED